MFLNLIINVEDFVSERQNFAVIL